jgi:electron transfer flavoprotein alpha/beta subunit
MQLPSVITVTSEKYTLRYATMPNIMAAMDKEVSLRSLSEIDLSDESLSDLSLTQCTGADIPNNEINCLIIDGQDEEEKSANLVKQLVADKLV